MMDLAVLRVLFDMQRHWVCHVLEITDSLGITDYTAR